MALSTNTPFSAPSMPHMAVNFSSQWALQRVLDDERTIITGRRIENAVLALVWVLFMVMCFVLAVSPYYDNVFQYLTATFLFLIGPIAAPVLIAMNLQQYRIMSAAVTFLKVMLVYSLVACSLLMVATWWFFGFWFNPFYQVFYCCFLIYVALLTLLASKLPHYYFVLTWRYQYRMSKCVDV